MEFIGSFWFFVIMIVLLLGLVGLLIILRNRRPED